MKLYVNYKCNNKTNSDYFVVMYYIIVINISIVFYYFNKSPNYTYFNVLLFPESRSRNVVKLYYLKLNIKKIKITYNRINYNMRIIFCN